VRRREGWSGTRVVPFPLFFLLRSLIEKVLELKVERYFENKVHISPGVRDTRDTTRRQHTCIVYNWGRSEEKIRDNKT